MLLQKETSVLVYGLVMNYKNVVKRVIDNAPAVREYIETRPFTSWQFELFGYGLTMARKASGIPDIGYEFVWIGSGSIAPFWTLPRRFTPKYITKADAERLEKFKLFLGDKNLKFNFLYTHSDEEPEEMQKIVPPANIEKLAYVHVVGAFLDPKAGVEELYANSR